MVMVPSCVVIVVAQLAVLLAPPLDKPTDPAATPLQQTALLVVKRLRIPKDAIKGLSLLPGIERVAQSPKMRVLVLKLKPNEPSSPREIWDVAVRLKLDPVRLVIPGKTFTDRPPEENGPEESLMKRGAKPSRPSGPPPIVLPPTPPTALPALPDDPPPIVPPLR